MLIDKKCTVYGSFTGEMPKTFLVRKTNGEVYYKRNLDGKTPRIKFNILHPGDYFTNVPFSIIKINDIELPEHLPELPDYTRNRVKDVTITYNPELSNTPARVHTDTGIIERSPLFYNLSKPLRVFILLHEVGHFYYGVNKDDIEAARKMPKAESQAFLKARMLQGEKDCDTFALIHFLKMGFNRSTAFQALKEVLKRNPENLQRLQNLLNNIKVTQHADKVA